MSVNTTDQNGFTITELLITLFVLSIALISFVTLFLTIDGVSDRTLDLSRANEAAFTKIQEYENLPYENIVVGDIGNNYEVEDFSASLPSTLADSTGKVFVQYENGSLTLKRVEVKVSYKQGSKTKTIDYANLIQISGVGR